MNSPIFLSSMAPFLNQFVQYKRALNRKYCADAEVLRLFDRYIQSRQITGWSEINSLVIDDFLRSHPRRVSARSYNHLLGTVHRFFKFAVIQQWIERDPVTASPRPETAARIPYLFDLDSAKRLLAVARSFPERSRARYRGLVYETIFALLYGLGLRVGEVVRLTLADVDFTRDLLFIRESKFQKTRIVPLGPNLAHRLKRYVEKLHGTNTAPERPLFSFTKRGCICVGTISQTFHTLLPRLELTIPPGVSPPRLHDLRHSFAVATLLRWYRQGIDPNRRLMHLATFLGRSQLNGRVPDHHGGASKSSCPALPGVGSQRRRPVKSVGQMMFAFFEDYLKTQKGLRPGSIRSYRDTLKLFLAYVASNCRRPITRLILSDLTAQRVLDFLHMIEVTRGNRVSTRNQRLAALHIFYRYLGLQYPEMLAEAQRVEAIPMKRTVLPQTDYLEHDEIETLFKTLPHRGRLSLRDRAIFTVLYNTGARVQEIADLRIADVDLDGPLRIRLHGKGDKWRSCPLWPETAEVLKSLTADVQERSTPLFISRQRKPLTRFGIYKIVKRHTVGLRRSTPEKEYRGVSPHVFRHSTAVGLLEQGVDINVIRAWLGHASLETTSRYAEITLRGKMAAVDTCLPPGATSISSRRSDGWRRDEELLKWLNSL